MATTTSSSLTDLQQQALNHLTDHFAEIHNEDNTWCRFWRQRILEVSCPDALKLWSMPSDSSHCWRCHAPFNNQTSRYHPYFCSHGCHKTCWDIVEEEEAHEFDE
jgi:hypothetical protein